MATSAIASTPTSPRISDRTTDQVSGTSAIAVPAAHTRSPAPDCPTAWRSPPATMAERIT
jgi:hypothetical protein